MTGERVKTPYLDVKEGNDGERQAVHDDEHCPDVLLDVSLHIHAADAGANKAMVVQCLSQVDVLDEDGVWEHHAQRHHPHGQQVETGR